MEALLDGRRARDSDVLSVGVRTVEGELLMAAGPHAATWTPPPEDKSTPEQMQVPIYQNGDQKWGNRGVSFRAVARRRAAGNC